jgi:hypothetical protein
VIRGRPTRATVYARLEGAIAELNERLGGLPSPKEAEFIWSDIWHLEAHHSTALEGNTLVLREVEALLERGRAVGCEASPGLHGGPGVRRCGSVGLRAGAGSGRLARWRSDQHLRGAADACAGHGPVWEVAPHPEAAESEAPGRFREHGIHAFDSGMQPPDWPLVPSMTEAWVSSVNTLAESLRHRHTGTPLPEQLAELHNHFEQVHPFIDGNGRAGRLLLNLVLVRLGYPPVIILKRQRPHYLTAMQRAVQRDFGPLGELLARAMYDNLSRFIVPNLAGPARLVPLAALANEEFSLVALRQAAQRGRLHAIQGADGIWRSSRRAVQDYRRNKGRRR